jgi:hypothetical protein
MRNFLCSIIIVFLVCVFAVTLAGWLEGWALNNLPKIIGGLQ